MTTAQPISSLPSPTPVLEENVSVDGLRHRWARHQALVHELRRQESVAVAADLQKYPGYYPPDGWRERATCLVIEEVFAVLLASVNVDSQKGPQKLKWEGMGGESFNNCGEKSRHSQDLSGHRAEKLLSSRALPRSSSCVLHAKSFP